MNLMSPSEDLSYDELKSSYAGRFKLWIFIRLLHVWNHPGLSTHWRKILYRKTCRWVFGTSTRNEDLIVILEAYV